MKKLIELLKKAGVFLKTRLAVPRVRILLVLTFLVGFFIYITVQKQLDAYADKVARPNPAVLSTALHFAQSADRLNLIKDSEAGATYLEAIFCKKDGKTCIAHIISGIPEPIQDRVVVDAIGKGKLVSLLPETEFKLSNADRSVLLAKLRGSLLGTYGPLMWNILTIAFMSLMVFSILGNNRLLSRNKYEVVMPDKQKDVSQDVIGYEDIKDDIQQLADIYRDRAVYAEYGIKSGFNFMFSGPPGTGKTQMATYLAQLLDAPMISASGANLETGYVGGGANSITSIRDSAVKLAKQYGRCLVFLDEAQNLFSPRGRGRERWSDTTADTFLAILDGVTTKDADVIWVVASNFDDSNMETDPAMMRRFQSKLFFRLPTKKERKGILEHYLSKTKCSEQLDITPLVDVTEDASPAQLKTIVETASMHAARGRETLTVTSLLNAWEKIHIGRSTREENPERQKQRYQIAIHELGHFLLSWREECTKYSSPEEAFTHLRTIKISTEALAKQSALGFVLSSNSGDHLQTKERLEWEIRSLLGGRAAEHLLLGEAQVSVGAGNDIERATKLLTAMCGKLALFNMDTPMSYLMDAGTRQEALPRAVQKEIQRQAKRLYAETYSILEQEQPLLERLLPVLMKEHLLTKDDLKPFLVPESVQLVLDLPTTA